MTATELPQGCERCAEQLSARNFEGFKGRLYDHYASREREERVASEFPLPVSMEFEISNTCNLECVMCNGSFSSSIRRNVERLPPIASPYDQRFAKQLEEFIPHLKEAKFLGGEPFLIPVYYEIWERIADLNPSIKNIITTNGTVLNRRARDLLDRIRAEIVVSIDSIVPENFERIRRNARFEQVMDNILEFSAYAKEKGTRLEFAVCPMQDNWQELPDFLSFCAEYDAEIWFNTVWEPAHATLRTLGLAEIEHVVEYLKARTPMPAVPGRHWIQNLRRYAGVIRQIESWAEQARNRARTPRPKRGERLWLDLPGASARAKKTALGKELLGHTVDLVERGYTVLSGAVESEACDEAITAFKGWCEKHQEYVESHRDPRGHLPRLANLHLAAEPVARLFSDNERVLRTLDFCFGYRAATYSSLFFERGAGQRIHHDLPYFRTEPEGFFFGMYVALEDVDEQNSPLMVIEGGHRVTRVDPIPICGRHFRQGEAIPPVWLELWNDYQSEVLRQTRRAGLEVRHIHLQKGDALIWHPALPKGAGPMLDSERTCYGVVFHATPENTPVYQGDVFFNPLIVPPPEPTWDYMTVAGRKMAIMEGPSF